MARLLQIFWRCSQKSKKGMPSQEADLCGVPLPVQPISREHLSLRSRGREHLEQEVGSHHYRASSMEVT